MESSNRGVDCNEPLLLDFLFSLVDTRLRHRAVVAKIKVCALSIIDSSEA